MAPGDRAHAVLEATVSERERLALLEGMRKIAVCGISTGYRGWPAACPTYAMPGTEIPVGPNAE